jgi:hypothetical protein
MEIDNILKDRRETILRVAASHGARERARLWFQNAWCSQAR